MIPLRKRLCPTGRAARLLPRGALLVPLAGLVGGCVGQPTHFTYAFEANAAAREPLAEAERLCRYEAQKHAAAVWNDADRFFAQSRIFMGCMETRGYRLKVRHLVM